MKPVAEMVEEARSDSETEENREESSSDELENSKNGGDKEGVSEYEKQRLSRIRENKARLQALGLPSLASSLLGSAQKQPKRKKGKGKKEEDDEYRPSDGDDNKMSSPSEEDDEEEDWKVRNDGSSGSRKGKNKHSSNTGKAKKKVPVQKHMSEASFVDDDDALQQAIALSLGGSSEISGATLNGPPQNSRTDVAGADLNERKGGVHIQEDTGRRKRRKPNTSRVQMTEDEVIMHFFQFDEAGKGNITVRDLQRVALAHDFTWTEKEMADMICSFDSNGKGKLSLEDFRKIAYRCNMLKSYEHAATSSKS